MTDLWWSLRFHLLRTFVATPFHFLIAAKDGLAGFRREFTRSFDQRWRGSEATEFKRRFFPDREERG